MRLFMAEVMSNVDVIRIILHFKPSESGQSCNTVDRSSSSLEPIVLYLLPP